jgi:hypothetical protein
MKGVVSSFVCFLSALYLRAYRLYNKKGKRREEGGKITKRGSEEKGKKPRKQTLIKSFRAS